MKTLSGSNAIGSMAKSGTIDAADEIIGPITVPGREGEVCQLSWAWSQTGGPSVVTLERSIDGGATWVAYLKSDGSINGGTLYGSGDIFAKAGFMFRFKIPTADFVTGTSMAGRFA